MVYFRTFVALAFFGVFWTVQRVEANPPVDRPPALLFLHSYHKAAWTDSLMSGYEAGLADYKNAQVAVEYMDTKRLNTPLYLDQLAMIYARKYGGMTFDVIVTSDDNALAFALSHQISLFKGAPIVFCGVNNLERHALTEGANVTGVLEHGDFAETLAVGARLFPKAERLWVLCDKTPTAQSNFDELKAVMLTENSPLQIRLLKDVTLEDMREEIVELGEKDLLFFIAFWQDKNDVPVSPGDLEVIFKQSPAPVLGRSEWMMNRGLLGGKCVSGYQQGLTAMNMAVKILTGTPAANIPIERESPNVFMFDFKELRRHGVSPNDLPPGSLVINQPASIYHQYKKTVLSLSGLFLVLIILVVALTISILRRKTVERELLKSEQRYQQAQKMEAIGQLAAGVAHDFNNLLTPIVGYTEIMLEDIGVNSPFEPQLKAIHESAESARDLTRELLSFARKQVLEMKVIELQSTLKRLKDMASRIIREDIELSFDISSELATVKADASQILQVCLNLISNAVDAMPKEGTLHVSAENVTFAQEHIFHHQTVPPGDYVMLNVTDSGTGIPADIQDRVFEPFFTTKPKEKGTGLGLAMVYGTVSQHNGYIWFTSDINRGTTFSICLPTCARQEKVEDKSQKIQVIKRKPKKPFGDGQTVLVAEDDAMVRRLACETLTRNGFNVIEAVDGKDALDKALTSGNDIDMLLSDVVMPRMDGVELYNEMIKTTPEIKVLFMSGYAGDILDDHGVSEDGFELIRKPFRFNELISRVRDVLEK